ncbi:MAG: hypothetical protein IJ685_12200 [Selenomonadaceae bacterium]|nr:hypothetical protein [Selenomonadaceae bacterium]
MGENIAGGQTSSEEVMTSCMNSPGHRANILNSSFTKLGVGYVYDSGAKYKDNWVQMFGGGLTSLDTVSTSAILTTTMTVQNDSLPEDDAKINTVIDADNTTITRGGTYTIAKNFTGTINIDTTDAVTIDGTSAGSLKDVRILKVSSNADLTIKNLNVTNERSSTIDFIGTDNKLTLAGKNVLKTSNTWAAVVNVGYGLTIDGTGSLDVTAGKQGAGIGTDSFEEHDTANVIINGGSITTTTNKGAGIGSGCGGSIGNITINGGTVTATADTGAGIGSGMDGSSEKISIGGNAKVTATSDDGAGIGKGCDLDGISTVGKITLSGKSSVLITQMNHGGMANFTRPTEFTINGKIYTDQQLLFENGAKKNLTERIIIRKTFKNGTNNSEYISRNDTSWYSATTINAGKGNDTINTGGANMLILAGEGDDSILSLGMGSSNPVVGYITLDAGTGNDTVWVGARMGKLDDYYSSISGGTGDDSIQVNGNYVTISGGMGNDNIGFEGSYAVFEYNSGDGNDTIEGFNSTSSLSVSGGKFFTLANGSDVIVKVGTGSITLKDTKKVPSTLLVKKIISRRFSVPKQMTYSKTRTTMQV